MHAIPLRRSALVDALAQQGLGAADAADFRKLAAFLGAYFHHDFYQELTEMKDLRARLDEAGDDDAAFATLETTFLKVLQRGNFTELPADESAGRTARTASSTFARVRRSSATTRYACSGGDSTTKPSGSGA